MSDKETLLRNQIKNIEKNKYNLDKSIHFMFFKRDENIYMLKKWKRDNNFYNKWELINGSIDGKNLEKIIKDGIGLVKKIKDKRNLFISLDNCPEIFEILNNIQLDIKNINNVAVENIILDECKINGYSQIQKELFNETIKINIFKRHLGKYMACDSDSEVNSLLVYTDASFRKDKENLSLGYGVVIKTLDSSDYIYQASKKIETDLPINTTSQAEAFAILDTILFLKNKISEGKLDKHQRFEVRSDELFNIGLLNNEKEIEEIKNDLTKSIINRILKEVKGLNFCFRWVKGHSFDNANVLADKLACEATLLF